MHSPALQHPRPRVERLEKLTKSARALGASALALILQQQIARNVFTTPLAAYTYSSANGGTITANAAAALGAQDGVVNIAGDLIFLPGGVAAAATDQGMYRVVNPGGATPFVLQRIGWMTHGNILPSGTEVKIGGEGTLFQNTVWAAMPTSATFTVGTTDSQFFPREVTVRVTLNNGQIGINAVPVLSTSSGIAISRALANTTAATIMYAPTNGGADGITPGYIGTALVVVQACVAAGTINVADLSDLHVTIFNGQR